MTGDTFFANSKDTIRIKAQFYTYSSGNLNGLRLNFALVGTNCCLYEESVNPVKEGNPGHFDVSIPFATTGLGGVAFKTGNSQGQPGQNEAVVCAEWQVDPASFLMIPSDQGGWFAYGSCGTTEDIQKLEDQKTKVQSQIAGLDKAIQNISDEIANVEEQLNATQAAIIEGDCDCEQFESQTEDCKKLCTDLNKFTAELLELQEQLANNQEQKSQVEEEIDNIESKIQNETAQPPTGNLLMPAFKLEWTGAPPEGSPLEVTIAKWSIRIDYWNAAGGYWTVPQVYEPLA